jgi:hypothetical protein
MQSLLVKAFSGLSGICSIAGFFVLFLKDKDKFLIAAIVYSVAITAFFVALTILVYRALSVKFKDKKYRKIATLQTFTCNDGVNVSFETRRLIQSKTPFLDEVECENKWLGNGFPVFKVNDVPRPYHKNPDPDKYDIETIKLDKIVAYNETLSYKTTFECNFSDHASRFGCKVEDPTDLVQFRILLGYKTGTVPPAKFYKRSIKPNSVSTDIFIEDIDFDQTHKLYFKILEKPEIGYNYFITWDK